MQPGADGRGSDGARLAAFQQDPSPMPTHAPNASPSSLAPGLLYTPEVQKAFLLIDRDGHGNLQDMVRICEIAAPPFREGERAEYLRRRLEETGLSRVEIDEEGNCIA